MSVIQNNLLMTPEGYQISRSVRLRRSASAYFNRTFGTPTNANIWTLSGWAKRGLLGTQISLFGASVSSYTSVSFLSGDTLRINLGNGTNGSLVTTQVFRDPSAYYHIAIAYDSTQATASNRIKLYINGVQVTSFSTASYPSLNVSAEWNYSGAVGTIGTAATEYWDGYLTEVNFIDGQALSPSSFGETNPVTGVWQAKKYAGTYGTNGFYLNFSDPSAATAAAIGKDSSGNGNNWTPNNISVTAGVTYDSMLDVPTLWADGGNGRGNYATWSPLSGASVDVLSYGNLRITNTAGVGNYAHRYSTIQIPQTGKWYWEETFTSRTLALPCVFGIASNINTSSDNTGTYGYLSSSGEKTQGATNTAYGASWTVGDAIGIAFDADTGSLTFYKNGTSQGVAFTGITGAYHAWHRDDGNAVTDANFGQRPFAYTPPTGFKALNTQNLPDATIKKGSQYFNALTYTGTGGARSISGLGFQPNFVWLKDRASAGTNSHQLFDSVRGVGKRLSSNTTDAETTNPSNGYLSTFDADGFSSVAGATDNFNWNNSGTQYAAWNWKKGATQGFDIVTYTGVGGSASFNHSLGVKPSFIIVKCRSTGGNSADVYHKDLGATKGIYLDLTNAAATSSVFWNNTEPTTTQFTVGATNNANGTGFTYVAWLWAEVAGFSKFGSYTGNGSADGPFVYLGFRPKFVMVKRTDSTGNWDIFDSQRIQYNLTTSVVSANTSNAEVNSSTYGIDILSNGFKLKTTDATINASGGTYIFAAFAENPFRNSLAR